MVTWECNAYIGDGKVASERATANNDPVAQNAAMMKVASEVDDHLNDGKSVTFDCEPV